MDPYLRMERVRFIIRSAAVILLAWATAWLVPLPWVVLAILAWIVVLLMVVRHHDPDAEWHRAWKARDRAIERERGRVYR